VAKVRGLDIPMVHRLHGHFWCEKFLVLYFDKGSFTLANLYGDSVIDYAQQLCLLLALDTMTQGEAIAADCAVAKAVRLGIIIICNHQGFLL